MYEPYSLYQEDLRPECSQLIYIVIEPTLRHLLSNLPGRYALLSVHFSFEEFWVIYSFALVDRRIELFHYDLRRYPFLRPANILFKP